MGKNGMVRKQVPEIRSDPEKISRLVVNKDASLGGVQRISSARAAEVPQFAPDAGDRQLKVVAILDDEPSHLEALGEVLVDEGLEILTCEDKRIFLRELPKLRVDLVITDITSPGMSGIQFLVEMKRNEEWKGIPVIVVSGCAGAEEENVRSLGAFEVFEKPYKVGELLAVIREALGGG